MEFLHAVWLAIVQGLTEFLPISSSAHLILLPELLGWSDQGLAFDVAVHVGTLLAVLIYLRADIAKILRAWLSGFQARQWDRDGQLGWSVIIATIPIGLIGLFAGAWIESNLRSALVIGYATIGFGIVLGWADRRLDVRHTDIDSLSHTQVLIVGFAQVLALIPGTSRSGITMTAMLALGYSRLAAARFSFLLAVPAIALPGMLKSVQLLRQPEQFDLLAILVGTTTAALVALACIRTFMRFVERVGMLPFVLYRILLGAVILYLLA